MNYILLVLFSLSTCLLNAQDVVGVYQIKSDSENFSLTRTLTIKKDGTFEFYNYRYDDKGIPKVTQTYGKGTWAKNKKVITFSTVASDLDSKYTLDFNNSKARFNTKSPRDKTNRIFADFIVFYDTEVDIAKRLKLFKSSSN